MGPRNKTSITRQTDFIRTPITDIFGGHIRLVANASCPFPSHHSMALTSSVAGVWKMGGDGVLCKSSILHSHAKKPEALCCLSSSSSTLFSVYFSLSRAGEPRDSRRPCPSFCWPRLQCFWLARGSWAECMAESGAILRFNSGP